MALTGLAEQTRWLDATDQARLVDTGQVTAPELLDAAIERIDALDVPLNAVVMRWYDHARSVAAGPVSGVLSGVPFLLKDWLAHYSGQRLCNGNRALCEEGVPSDVDTATVRRFREAGLVTVGRTNAPEFAAQATTEPTAWGPAHNPWSLPHTPGGSSGGAAVAVAAGLVPVAHASDGAGSIRIPASCCGLVGLKPSRGRVSAAPFGSENGPGVELGVSRSVRDTATLLDALAGPDVGDAVIAPTPRRPYRHELDTAVEPLRVGLLDHDPQGEPVDQRCVDATRTTATLLESLGHHVEPAFPAALADPDHTVSIRVLGVIAMRRNLAHLAEALGREVTADDVETSSWWRAEQAARLTADDHAAVLESGNRLRRAVQQWWTTGFDLLLTPTLPQPPALLGAPPSIGPTTFTRPFNLTGQPAVTLPLHHTDDGLPIGTQLVAAYAREDLLVRTAAHLELAAPWADRTPSDPPSEAHVEHRTSP